MADCVYLGSKRKNRVEDRDVYDCLIYGTCTKIGQSHPYPSCEHCKKKLTLNDEDFSDRFEDQLTVVDRMKNKTHGLRNMLCGRPAFLVCGGPSAKRLDLTILKERGVWSLAVNNMAGYCHPRAFVCSDPPQKFHNGIWLDSTVMKFIPTPKMKKGRGSIRQKVDSKFKTMLKEDGDKVCTQDCPNVWGFERRSWLKPDESFFLEPTAAWGNHNSGVKRTGEKKTVCTMLLGLRILYYLGARKIYLLGVDFHMDPEADIYGNYAFSEKRDKGAINSNNAQFRVVNEWMVKMQQNGIFEKFGLEIYNCCQDSGLRAFPHVPFDGAVSDMLSGFPNEPFDLDGWYEK